MGGLELMMAHNLIVGYFVPLGCADVVLGVDEGIPY